MKKYLKSIFLLCTLVAPLAMSSCAQKTENNQQAETEVKTEEVKTMTVAQLDALLDEAFSFDNFAWQQENNVIINEPFRADGLDRILFRCPHCGAEGKTEGKGTTLTCHSCGVQYELTETGYLKCLNAEGKFIRMQKDYPDLYQLLTDLVVKE